MKPIKRYCKLYCANYPTCTKTNCTRKLMFNSTELYMADEQEYDDKYQRDMNMINNGAIPNSLSGNGFVHSGMSRKRGA